MALHDRGIEIGVSLYARHLLYRVTAHNTEEVVQQAYDIARERGTVLWDGDIRQFTSGVLRGYEFGLIRDAQSVPDWLSAANHPWTANKHG